MPPRTEVPRTGPVCRAAALSGFRSPLLQSLMWSVPIEVTHILDPDALYLRLAQHKQMVRILPAPGDLDRNEHIQLAKEQIGDREKTGRHL